MESPHGGCFPGAQCGQGLEIHGHSWPPSGLLTHTELQAGSLLLLLPPQRGNEQLQGTKMAIVSPMPSRPLSSQKEPTAHG